MVKPAVAINEVWRLPLSRHISTEECSARNTRRICLSGLTGQETEQIWFRFEGVDKSRDLRFGDRFGIDYYKGHTRCQQNADYTRVCGPALLFGATGALEAVIAFLTAGVQFECYVVGSEVNVTASSACCLDCGHSDSPVTHM